MRLIYVDSDAISVRKLHSEFLDYRGLNWSLTHCQHVQEALEKIEQDHFQCMLLRADGNVEAAAFALNELVQSASCPPVLTITDQYPALDHLQLILDGSDDCLNRSETNGSGIMRRLRMMELRNTVWEQQAKDLAEYEDTADWISTVFSDGKLDARSVAETVGKSLRVAHVCYGTSLTNATNTANSDIEYTRYEILEELINALDENILSFDAILLEQSVFEEVSESALSKLKRFLLLIPAVVLTLEKSDFAALSYLERGFTDCITADRISSTALTGALRKAVVRRRRSLVRSLSEQQVGPTVSDRRGTVRASQNRRRHIRFLAKRSVVAIPVLSNDSPDIAGRCEATTIDVSLGGMGVTIPDREQLPSRNWIIGIEQAGMTKYVNAYLRRVDYRDGELHVGLIFQGEVEDMLHHRNLWPAIEPDSKRFETRLSNAALDQWAELGVLQRQLVRRARVCPECEAVCSVGTGCSQCGGFELHFKDLIHHFACAHVNQAEKFENKGAIQCPKCLRDNLVAGADFEMIRSQYLCAHCEYEGDVTAQVGCCMNCQLSFPLEMGKEVDVYGYSVERMDVLALVDSAR